MDDVLSSMKDELNKAKIELVFALEEKERLRKNPRTKLWLWKCNWKTTASN